MWVCASPAWVGVAGRPPPGWGRRAGAPGPHPPRRLVGAHEPRELLAGEPLEPLLDLAVEDVERLLAVALVERLADADDRGQPGTDRGHRLPVHRGVGLAEQHAPLGVPDDDVFGPRFADHLRADLA